MQRAWMVAFAVSAALLVGCTHPARRAPLPPAPASAKAQHPAKAQPLPTDSPVAPLPRHLIHAPIGAQNTPR